ncbi:hypothetical protein WA026_012941 [Henosepilachna vigintioctopunctata]|uniref:Uncharacterized protein n=1 Tax=Henosepilachna vigintioctopunctata TaxID=420089 RepID=A0AAW1TSC9_9CUCU
MKEYFFIQNRCNRSIKLDPYMYPETDKFFIQENGTIYTPDFEMGTTKFSERYCVDVFQDESIGGKLLAMMCIPDVINKEIIQQFEDCIHIAASCTTHSWSFWRILAFFKPVQQNNKTITIKQRTKQ